MTVQPEVRVHPRRGVARVDSLLPGLGPQITVEAAVAGLGDPLGLLLSGPPAGPDGEGLESHLARWSELPPLDGAGVRALLRASALDGRGGGGFPLARKVETAMLAGGRPVLIVNASESEPASHKDRTLCSQRPHLVLDGAALVAVALGIDEVVIHLHRALGSPVRVLEAAMAERHGRSIADPRWSISAGPDRYVSGESSAVARYVAGGEARPLFTTIPLAAEGPSGRPTVISNAETVAHLSVIARMGPDAWSGLGTASSPGPRLVTLTGAVNSPGRVLEVSGPATLGEILATDGMSTPPAAVLVGGFAGTWLLGDDAWQTPFSRDALAAVGVQPGCGLLGVLPHGACGLTETARIVRYLAGESAGQCGTCVAGLPRLADSCESLAAGTFRKRGVRKMSALADTVLGSGACGHPDAVVRLIRSTLDVFEDDVVRHLAGHACRAADHAPVFAVPEPVLAIGRDDTREWT